MTDTQYAVPKEEWGEGLWQHEPDEEDWTDEATVTQARRTP